MIPITLLLCIAVVVTGAFPAGGTSLSAVHADEPAAPADPAAAATPGTRAYSESLLPHGRYLIRPLLSDTRAVSVAGSSKKSGANIRIENGSMAARQIFAVNYDSKGRALIKNINSGKYIGVSGKKAKKGANIAQAAKSSSKAIRWVLEPAGTSNGQKVFRLRSTLSQSYCMQLSGGKALNKANIRLWTRNKGKAEKFIFVPAAAEAAPAQAPAIEDGVYRIGSALSSSLSLAVTQSTSKNNTVPVMAPGSNDLSQLFIFAYENGYYRIRPLVSGKSLTVRGGNVLARTAAVQYSDKDKAYQRFRIDKASDGSYTIVSRAGGLALRVASGRASAGQALETWYPSAARSQRFTLTRVESLNLAEGAYSLSPYAKAGLNLAPESSSRKSGAAYTAASDGRAWAQKFLLDRRKDGSYTLMNEGSQMLLTASGDKVVQKAEPAGGAASSQIWYADLVVGGMRFINKKTGTALQLSGSADAYSLKLAKPSGSTKQAFVPEKTELFDGGLYRVDCKIGSASLGIEDASFWALADVRTGKADGSGTQAWYIKDNGDGTVTMKNQRSGKPAEAASATVGARVRQNLTSGEEAQDWFLEQAGGGWFRLESAAAIGGYLGAGAADASGGADVTVTAAALGDGTMWRFVPVTLKKAGSAMPKKAADAIVKEAKKHLGKKYVFGAEGPSTFDCSGYVYYVMNKSGVKEMTRVTAQDIYESCVKISSKSARRGDLIFFTKTYNAGRPVTHLGIYLGNGKMIHAGSPVQISKVTTKYFKAHFYGFGRFA